MNKNAFKTFWNDSLKSWVAVPETSCFSGKNATSANGSTSAKSGGSQAFAHVKAFKGLKLCVAALGFAGLSFMSLPSFAQSVQWIGGNGNWQEGSKWTGGVVPQSSKDVAIINGSVVTISRTTETQNLDLSNNSGIDITSGSLDVARLLTIGAGGSKGLLNVTGDHSSVYVTEGAVLSSGSILLDTKNGTFRISNGSDNGDFILGDSGEAIFEIRKGSSLYLYRGDLIIGQSAGSKGELNIIKGNTSTAVSADNIVLGKVAGAEGSITLNEGWLDVRENVTIGDAGKGVITIERTEDVPEGQTPPRVGLQAKIVTLGAQDGSEGALNILKDGVVDVEQIVGGAADRVHMVIDGGLISARQSSDEFIKNVGAIQIKEGGATINTKNHNVGIVGSTFETTLKDAVLKFEGGTRLTINAQNDNFKGILQNAGVNLILTKDNAFMNAEAVKLGSSTYIRIGDTKQKFNSTSSDGGTIIGSDTAVLTLNNDEGKDSVFKGSLEVAGQVIKVGKGRLEIARGQNSNIGDVIVRGGTLALTVQNAIQDAKSVQIEDDAVLDIQVSSQATPVQKLQHLSGTEKAVILAAGAELTLNNSQKDTSYLGVIKGTHLLIKDGSEKLSLKAEQVDFTGALRVKSGTLVLIGDKVFANAQSVELAYGTTLDATDTEQSFNSLSGYSSTQLILGAGKVALVNDIGKNTEYTGVFIGTGELDIQGLGQFTAKTASDDFTGILNISEGTLALDATDAFKNASEVNLAAGTTVKTTSRDQTFHHLSGLSGASIELDGRRLTVVNDQESTSFLGSIKGTSGAGLIVAGGETFSIVKQDDFKGGITVKDGSLLDLLESDAIAKADAVTLKDAGSTLGALLSDQKINHLSGDSLTLVMVGLTDLTLNNSSGRETSFSGTFVGDSISSITKTGSGTLKLDSSHNLFFGDIKIEEGNIKLTGNNAFNWASSIALSGNGKLQATNTQQTINQLSGSASTYVEADAGSKLKLYNAQGENTTFDGTLRSSGDISKTGGGELTLTSNNNKAGSLKVEEGKLIIAKDKRFEVTNGFSVQANAILGLEIASSTSNYSILANTAQFAADSIIDIKSFDGVVSDRTYTLIHTYNGVTNNGFKVSVGGQLLNNTAKEDVYVTANAYVENNNKDVVARIGLVWNNTANNSAHGTFNIAAGDNFTIGDSTDSKLKNNTNTNAYAFGWNGKDLTKKGAGALTFLGAKEYTGITDIQDGTLAISATNAIRSSSAVKLSGAAAKLQSSGTQTLNALEGVAGSVINSTGGNLFLNNDTGVETTFAGQINHTAGGYAVKKIGAGTLTLSGSSSMAALNVEGGRLNVSDGVTLTLTNALTTNANTVLGIVVGASPSITAGSASFNASSTLDVKGFNSMQSGQEYVLISTTGGITGSYKLIIDGRDASSTTIDLDTYVLGGVYLANSNKDLVAKMGLVWENTGANSAHGTFNIQAGKEFTIGSALQNNTVNTAYMAGWNGADLTKKGDGTLVLGAANLYTGITDVQGGTLKFTHDDAVAASSKVKLAGTAMLDTQATQQTINVLEGSQNSTLKASGGTLNILNGTAFAGKLQVEQGMLNLTQNNSFANAKSVELSAGGGIDAKSTQQTFSALQGDTTSKLNADAGGAVTLRYAADAAYNGQLTGSGTFNKSGNGLLTLLGSNSVGSFNLNEGKLDILSGKTLTVSNGFNVSAGTVLGLTISSSAAINAGSAGFANGSTLDIRGLNSSDTNWYTVVRTSSGVSGDFNVTFDGVALGSLIDEDTYYSKSVKVQNNDILAGMGLVWNNVATNSAHGTFNITGATQTISSVLANNTATGAYKYGWDGQTLTKKGAGTLILSAVNTYTGLTKVQGGTLKLGAGNAIALSSGVQLSAGTALDTQNTNQTIQSLSGDSSSTVKAGNGSLGITNGSGFSGKLQVEQGTLSLTQSNSFDNASTVDIATGAGINAQTTNQRFNTLSGGLGSSVTGTGSIVLNNDSGRNSAFNGSLLGTGSYSKTGAGTLTLAGLSSVGVFNVAQGRLDVAQGHTLTVAGALGVSAGATVGVTVNNTPSVIVGGVADFMNGSVLDIKGLDGVSAGQTYTLVQTGSGVTGNYRVTVNGQDLSAQINENVYVSGNVFTKNNDIVAEMGLVWNNTSNSSAHGTFNVAGTDTFSIGSALANNTTTTAYAFGWDGKTLTKKGTGTLILNAANTYTGLTDVQAGMLELAQNNAVASSSEVKLAAATVLNTGTTNQTIQKLTGNTGATLKTSGGTLDITDGTGFAGGVKVEAGTLSLAKANSFGNASYVDLAANTGLNTQGNNQTLNALTGGAGSSITASAGTVKLNNASGVTTGFAGSLNGAGTYEKTGAGVFALSSNSSMGALNVSEGAFNIAQNTSVNLTNQLSIATGAVLGVSVGLAPSVTAGSATFASGAVIDINNLDNVALNTAHTLIHTNTGITAGNYKVTVNGTDLATTVNEDTYIFGSAYVQGNDFVAKIGLAWSSITANSAHGTFNIASGKDFTLSTALADNTVAAAHLYGWNGKDLTKKGTGTLKLNAVNTYTGVTDVQAGQLVLASNQAIATSQGVKIASNATVDVLATNQTLNALQGAANSNLKGNAGSTLTLNNTTGSDTVFSGSLASQGAVNKTGAGQLTLGANGSAHTMNVQGGQLKIASGKTITVSDILTVNAGASLGVTVGSVSAVNASQVNFGANAILDITGLSAITDDSTSYTLVHTTGGITGHFDVHVNGASLSSSITEDVYKAANAYVSGNDIVAKMGLVWNNTSSSSAHGTFNIASGSFIINSVLANNGTTGAYKFAWDGKTLTKKGAGTLTLNAANTYTGVTDVQAGTLELGQNNAVAASSEVKLAASTVLNTKATNQTVQKLTGDVSSTLRSSGGTLDITHGTGFAGAVKVEAGTLSLAQANSFINAKSVELAANAGLNTQGTNQTLNALTGAVGSSVTASAGTVKLNNASGVNTSFAGSMNGAATFEKTGVGMLTLSNNNHVNNVNVTAGTLNVASGKTLQVDNSLNVASSAVLGMTVNNIKAVTAQNAVFANGSFIDIKGLDTADMNQTYTLLSTTGGITGSFNVSINGVALSNVVTEDVYTVGSAFISGNDVVAKMGLVWNSTSNSSAHGAFNIASGDSYTIGSVLANNSVTTAYAFGWDGKALTKKGTGKLILNAANTYTGLTDVQAGTLELSQNNAVAASSEVKLAASTVLNTKATSQSIQKLTGDISSTLKSSGGTLDITNGTGFAGDVKVEAGVLSLAQADSFVNAKSVELTANTGLNTQGTNQTLNALTGGAGASITASAGTVKLNNASGVNTSFAGSLNGAGTYEKTGAGTFALLESSNIGALNINGGAFNIGVDKTVTLTGNLNVASGAVLGVVVANDPAVKAQQANFVAGSTLDIEGLDGVGSSQQYTLVETTSGVTGSFNVTVNGTALGNTVNQDTYVTGKVGVDGSGNNIVAQLGLVWNNISNNSAHGIFNIANGQSFDVGVVLADNTVNAAAYMYGWDGKTLTKKGDGTLILDASNTYTGITDVQAGKLILKKNNAVGGSADLKLGAGTVLEVADTTQSINKLTGDASTTYHANGGTLTLNDGTGFSGKLAVDSGALALTQDNSFANAVSVAMADNTQLNLGATNQTLNALSGGEGTALNSTGGTLNLNNNSMVDTVFKGSINATGTVNKTGSGALVLDHNSSVGNLNINDGTLDISKDKTLTVANAANIGSTGILGVNAGNNPALQADTVHFNNGSIIDVKGISGVTGSDVKQLVETQSGITGNIKVTVNGADLSNTVDEDTYLTGHVELDSAHKKLLFKAGLVWDSVSPNTSHGSYNIVAGETFTIDKPLSNNGNAGSYNFGWDGQTLTKKGEGTLVLDAVNTYTGSTEVNAGKLIVGSAANKSTATVAGHVNVKSGATLGGHGLVNGNVNLASGATLSPGNSFGTLNVNGNLTFNPGSVYEFEADQDGNADKIIVSGTATVTGGIVNVLASHGEWAQDVNYTLLSAAGGVVGQFGNVKTNLAFLNPNVTYSGNEVKLKLSRNSVGFGQVGTTPNQVGVGNSIGMLSPKHPVYRSIVGLDAVTAARAYDNLSGEIHASTIGALLSNSRYARTAINQHLLGQDFGVRQNTPETNRNLWISVWGRDGHVKGGNGIARIDNHGSGLMLGVDLPVNLGKDSRIGIATGFETTKVKNSADRNSQADVDAYHLMLYGATSAGPVDLRAGAGYSWLDLDTERNIWVSGLAGTSKASHRGTQMQLFIEGSHQFELSEQARVSPYLGFAYTKVKTNSFNEKGSDASLHGDSNSKGVASSTLGVRGDLKWGSQKQHSVYADIGWQHNFGNSAPEAKLSFAGGVPFSTKGTKLDRDSAVIGLGANFELQRNLDLNVGYEGAFGSKTRDNSLKLRLNWKF